MGSGWHTPSSACLFQCHSTAHPISNRADHEACLNQQNRSASQLHTKALRSLKRFYSLSWNWSDMLTKACLFANENMQSNFTNYQPTASVNSDQTAHPLASRPANWLYAQDWAPLQAANICLCGQKHPGLKLMGNNVCFQFKLLGPGVDCFTGIANWYTILFCVIPIQINICLVNADVQEIKSQICRWQLSCECYKKVKFTKGRLERITK